MNEESSNPPTTRPRSFTKILRGVTAATLAVILTASAQHVLARPDLRSFDPQLTGRMESAMWRSYYEGRWLRLGWQTMRVACGQYGFSWWDGARMSAHAAISAMRFRKNADDPRCVTELASYYRIIQHAAPSSLDVQTLAALELQWWKERRQNVAPEDYARTIARLTGALYGIEETVALPAARLRTEAMAYRDARRDGKMTDADWAEISRQLTEAHTLLKQETGPRP